MCTSSTVLPLLRLEHVQSKASAQRLSGGKKLPTLKIHNRRKGKAEANKRVGVSKKVMEEVNQGGTSNQLKMLTDWLTKGNSLKDSSSYGIRTSQVGAGSVSENCIMVGGGQGGGGDSGHRSDVGSNYSGGGSGVGVGDKTGSGEDGSGDCVMDMTHHTSDSGGGGGSGGISHTRVIFNRGYGGGLTVASVAPTTAVGHFTPEISLQSLMLLAPPLPLF